MSTSPRTSAISRLVASDLGAAGLLRSDDEASAARILDDRLATEPVTTQRPTAARLAAEVAGYLGGILVVAAAAVFLASQWSRMDSWTRVLALLVAAADLGLASFAVRRTAPEAGSTSELARQARLLLAGTLGVGAAAVAGGAAGVWAMQVLDLEEPVPQRIGFALACLLMAGVYALTGTAVAHLGIAFTAALTILTTVMTMTPPGPRQPHPLRPTHHPRRGMGRAHRARHPRGACPRAGHRRDSGDPRRADRHRGRPYVARLPPPRPGRRRGLRPGPSMVEVDVPALRPAPEPLVPPVEVPRRGDCGRSRRPCRGRRGGSRP